MLTRIREKFMFGELVISCICRDSTGIMDCSCRYIIILFFGFFLINKVFSHFYYCGTACGSQLISFSTKISSNTLARHHFTGKDFNLMNKGGYHSAI